MHTLRKPCFQSLSQYYRLSVHSIMKRFVQNPVEIKAGFRKVKIDHSKVTDLIKEMIMTDDCDIVFI